MTLGMVTGIAKIVGQHSDDVFSNVATQKDRCTLYIIPMVAA
jgi:hypothetical protein